MRVAGIYIGSVVSVAWLLLSVKRGRRGGRHGVRRWWQ